MNMPRTVTMADAQNHFPQILADVCDGAEVIIARNNQPVAALVNTARLHDFQRLQARLDTRAQPGDPPRSASAKAKMEKAIENLKAVRKRVKFSATFEEIIAARDEGRR